MSNKNYKYTLNEGFTEEQRNFYEENGYIVFRKLIPEKDIDICHQRFLDVCSGKVHVPTVMKVKKLGPNGETRSEFTVNKIQEILYDEKFFDHYAAHPKIVEVIKMIIGPNVTAVHSMLINKPPDVHEEMSAHPMHQDLHYFPFRPANKIAASWTAMEDVTEKNGCLFVLPGSHKGPLFSHDYTESVKNKLYHGVFGFNDVPKVMFPMEKGDTIFFHPLLLHGSGPNFTQGFRKAISVHYADSKCDFINVIGTFQEGISKEIESVAEKNFKLKIHINTVWKMKSRLICGEQGVFQQIDSHL
ncbi:PREDICTED: phytanoyl-CoA dioxygenase, peroxisomal-like [Nicrophorus vespilloides]|uniref:phytanoyl-CoA dioxygenase n=1 Tax=Nicrophorus vespilloides TaxID=110193 RepID=A0ABM1MZS6_NICVS|nr:PREDICTED: phytanoyl-CoA dioxygenase, peroxisomal-like [Nicrophorus vespilloides]